MQTKSNQVFIIIFAGRKYERCIRYASLCFSLCFIIFEIKFLDLESAFFVIGNLGVSNLMPQFIIGAYLSLFFSQNRYVIIYLFFIWNIQYFCFLFSYLCKFKDNFYVAAIVEKCILVKKMHQICNFLFLILRKNFSVWTQNVDLDFLFFFNIEIFFKQGHFWFSFHFSLFFQKK